MEPVSVLRFNTTKRGHVEEGRIHVQGTARKNFLGGGVLTSCVDLDKRGTHAQLYLPAIVRSTEKLILTPPRHSSLIVLNEIHDSRRRPGLNIRSFAP